MLADNDDMHIYGYFVYRVLRFENDNHDKFDGTYNGRFIGAYKLRYTGAYVDDDAFDGNSYDNHVRGKRKPY